ncbi:MAG: hypothetical protein HY300_06335 [Verrucomicrobia bacterium]|nr:hypothetical protein [Verrucomicrobiota bacterium]
MIRAFAYLQITTLKNRLLCQVRRFRQPKYWLGAIAFGFYIYAIFLRHFVGAGRRTQFMQAGGTALGEDTLFLMETGFSLLAFGLVAMGWIFAKDRAALDFTEAEIAFLFPAPVSRHTLIHFKLIKWQLSSLFGALFLTIFSSRNAAAGSPARHIIAWWLIMATMNLHSLGASFTRTKLLDRGMTTWTRRLIVLGALGVMTGVSLVWLRANVPPLKLEVLANAVTIAEWVHQAVDAGPVFWILLPFRVMIRPFFVAGAASFAIACLPVLGLMALHYWWVISSDAAFEEGSVEKAAKRAEIIAAARAGNWQAVRNAGRNNRKSKPLFTLRPEGLRAVALFRKNLVAVGNMFSLRVWFALAAVALGGAVFTRLTYADSPMLLVGGSFCAGFAGYLFFFGPQVLRQDLRTDLMQADLLKMLPLPGWQVVLGEVLAPLTVMTAAQWLLLTMAAVLFSGGEAMQKFPPANLTGIGFAAALLLPFVNMVAFLVLNGAVLAFPGWFTLGPQSAQGFEATGQRLIMAIAQMFVLLVALAIPGGLFAFVFYIGRFWISTGVMAPVAAVAAALVLAGEIVLGLWALGKLFEKFDLSAEPSA